MSIDELKGENKQSRRAGVQHTIVSWILKLRVEESF